MSSDDKNKVIEILNRFKSALNLKNDAALARYLEIRPNAVASWKFRGALDHDLLIEKRQNLNLHWLFTGNGNPFLMENEVVMEVGVLKQVLHDVEEVELQEKLNLTPLQKSELILLLLEEIRDDNCSVEGLKRRIKRLIHFVLKLS